MNNKAPEENDFMNDKSVIDPFTPPTETATGREFYGFVLYLASIVGAVMYIIWIYVPEKNLHKMGITYYADRHFGAVIPIWVVGLIPFILLTLNATILLRLPRLDSFDSLADEHSRPMDLSFIEVLRRNGDYTDLHEIPITIMNAAMFNKEPKES